jgi:hypothetical protein
MHSGQKGGRVEVKAMGEIFLGKNVEKKEKKKEGSGSIGVLLLEDGSLL